MDITFHRWGNGMVYNEAQIKCFSLSRCNAIFNFGHNQVHCTNLNFSAFWGKCTTICLPHSQQCIAMALLELQNALSSCCTRLSRSWLLDLSREDWIYSFLIKADFIIHTTLCLSTWLFVCWWNLKQRTVAENAKRKCFPWKCQGFC